MCLTLGTGGQTMIRVFTLDVLISCIITAFIIGGLIGFFIMCCFIAGRDSDADDQRRNDLERKNKE